MLEKHKLKTTLWLHSGNGTVIFTPRTVENFRYFGKYEYLNHNQCEVHIANAISSIAKLQKYGETVSFFSLQSVPTYL